MAESSCRQASAAADQQQSLIYTIARPNYRQLNPVKPDTRMTGRGLNYIVLCFVGVLLLLAFVGRLQNTFIDGDVGQQLIRSDLAKALTACVLDSGDQTHWQSLVERTRKCVSEYTIITYETFVKFHMGRYGELKVFLPMLRQYSGQCYELTIGIGGDTQVEKEFHDHYPKCLIFGIEPASDQTADFSSVGTVISNAVGVVEGRLPMTIRSSDGSYFKQEVDIVPLPKLLDKHVGSRLVHFATIDIEGFDYTLLDAFRYQQSYDLAGVVFCQIDVELHGKEKQMEGFDFEKFLPEFLADSPYVPVFATMFLEAHIKLTLVHSENAQCQQMFGFSSYFLQ